MNKTGIAAMVLIGSLATAHASPLAPPVSRQLYTCAQGGLSRVAAVQVTAGQLAPCCTGLLGCPQLLANTGLARPRARGRT